MKKSNAILIPTLFAIIMLAFTASGYCAESGTLYIVNGEVSDGADIPSDADVKVIEPLDSHLNKYTDRSNGFSLSVPRHMAADYSLSQIRTVFYDQDTKIEVYYDNFAQSISSARDYIFYGNKALLENSRHHIESDTFFDVNGLSVHMLKWQRPKLARVENDKNHYIAAEIIKDPDEVYTIFIKSTMPIENEMELVSSLRLHERTGRAGNYKLYQPSATRINPETTTFYQTYFSRGSRLKWGIFEPSAPENLDYLHALEATLDFSFPFILRYQTFDENFPARGMEKAYANRKYVELTLQTVRSEAVNALQAGNYNGANINIIYDILDGKYDDYLHKYAQDIKSFGHPVLLRLNNEMNGDWCWYSAYYTGKDTDVYKAVWHYLRRIFEANDVDNVLWVWNPHDVSLPGFKWNHYMMYYPGDEYVDIIGVTGYNTGTYFEGESWRGFKQIYDPVYMEYNQFFDKPLIITEFGSNSVGGDKVAWLQEMFNEIGKYRNIKLAIWWNGIDYDPDNRPGRVYILDETPATIDVFKARLKEYR